MSYVVDVHTHTIVSGHAYTTLLENVLEASNNGIEVLGTTEHGPKMPGAPHLFHFGNLKVIPRELYGVTLINGSEANIVDYGGKLDLPVSIQKRLDIIIASLHDVCIEPGSREENTSALLCAMDNPLVDIIGHSGNPTFPIYEKEVVRKAKEKNVLIEINNSSFMSRPGSEENCRKIAALCRDYKVNVIIGSDAHTCFHIGKFDHARNMLESIGMPEELIMNNEKNKILIYLKNKGKLSDINLD
jgi:putative hydrolase